MRRVATVFVACMHEFPSFLCLPHFPRGMTCVSHDDDDDDDDDGKVIVSGCIGITMDIHDSNGFASAPRSTRRKRAERQAQPTAACGFAPSPLILTPNLNAQVAEVEKLNAPALPPPPPPPAAPPSTSRDDRDRDRDRDR